MKRIYTLAAIALICHSAFCQNNVGIGTNTPDASAKLDISSTNMGMLIPRVSLSNVSTWGLASGTGTTGMMVYNTNAAVTGGSGAGFYFWTGTWTKIVAGTTAKLSNGKVWIGNASNDPDEQSLSGDVAISNTGVATIQDNAVDGTDIALGSDTNGDIMYYNGTDWVRLAAGTSGQILRTNGAAAPSWVNGTTIIKAQNGVNIQTAAPNASAADPYVELGGTLVRATTITQGSNLFTIANNGTANTTINLSSTGDFDVQDNGTSALFVRDDGNVGMGTVAPGFKLHVVGDVHPEGRLIVQNSVDGGSTRGIRMWSAGDANWGIYMGQSGAGRSMAAGTAVAGAGFTQHAIRFRVNNSASQGFVFENSGEQLLYSVRASDGMAYHSGNVGIGTQAPGYQLTLGAGGTVFGVENTANFAAKNSAGTYETYFWPRWSDNVMYMNYGSAGLNLRNNSSATAMFIDPDLSVDVRRGVLFNCDDCGSTTTIDGNANWGDLVIQGRVLSTNSNLHLSPPGGSRVVVNSTYRSAGGASGTTGIDIQDGGIRMNKNYLYYQNYRYCNCFGAGSGSANLGAWDFCAVAHVGFKNNQSTADEDDDVQCGVYPSTYGVGEQSYYNNTYSHAYNSRPTWYMYYEAYEDSNGVTCAANCINFD